ncbi:hypothetical protein EK21DRAFT_85300 [Setomelanomma holmii]|uniref:Uncharacterized protein n=1 Tax=Setomelanomma holmii TaxID=210430 RepID=A0A9P4HGF9_9PLEO|nr:hypothetical protein EK21DRAFT_85300 [Setomelanomma holmii]
MADKRTVEVTNAFTKERFRRNTRGNQWIPTNSSNGSLRRPRPDEPLPPRPQQSLHLSPVVPTYEETPRKKVSPLQSQSPVLRATIDHYEDLRSLEVVDPPATDDGASNTTIFPHFLTSTRDPTAKIQVRKETHTPRNIIEGYNNARGIYAAGPKGEGQKLWLTYCKGKKLKSSHTEVEQDPSSHHQAPSRPPMRFPYETFYDTAPQVPPQDSISFDNLQPRKSSVISQTSAEINVRIDPEIQRPVNMSKPLPPVPQLRPAPTKQSRRGKAEPFPKKPVAVNKNVSSASSGVQHLRQPHDNGQAGERSPRRSKESKAGTLWKTFKDLKDLIPDEHAPGRPHQRPNADILKSKISRPMPIDMSQVRRSPHERLTERQRGKKKANHEHVVGPSDPRHWQDRLVNSATSAVDAMKQMGRDRKGSNASFACRGIQDPGHVGEVGPSRQARHHVEREDEHMFPKTLFSATRGGTEAAPYRVSYQPYNGILEEYMDRPV